jgi:DUF2950 family protein
MILLSSVLRACRSPCVLPLAALAVTTVFLTVATGVLAQERYRSPEEAVAALVDAVRTDAPQQMMQVLGPGSDEIVRSGDPIDDAAMRRRFLAAFSAEYQILPDVEGKRWAPYQGYYYKILTRQGPNAPGGEVDYMVNGNMVGGFALVAYPVRYRNAGLMTFLVNHKGLSTRKTSAWK